MSQFRKDPFSDRWVIFAEGRERRPNEYEQTAGRRRDARCPFCVGHEVDTPPAIHTYRSNGQRDDEWLVRVVPNMYPALVPRGTAEPSANGLYQTCAAVGAHEVIVETPRHVASFTELTDAEARCLLLAYRDRILVHGRAGHLKYALVFKNVGPAAGASLEHAHSQVVATPMIPPELQRELTAAERLYKAHGQCFFCRVIADELTHATRLVAQSDRFVAICPYASRMPYELWVLPREHSSKFESQDPTALAELADFLRLNLGKLESRHRQFAYNYFIHTGPFDTPHLNHYHWHIEVFPRLTTTAGLEWGAGYFINPVLPEHAAAIMRS